MCGFAGFTGMLEERREIINKMMSRIVHRGPDMGDCYVGDGIALGFRRLSIIDLSEKGSQPIPNEDGTLVMVYNGEIYNFEELREELVRRGHVFRAESDSEVILHGYEEYGEDIVRRLRGMFAFVIWNERDKSLFGARDYFGIKPFYYGKTNDGEFIFGSEIKSFLDHPRFERRVSREVLRAYLTYQYSADEQTFFDGVNKLPPAHYFFYRDGKMSVTRYWDAVFDEKNISFDDCISEIESTVKDSVKAHKISDVKVGAFLSGGVDSSYITALQMPDETFSVGFDYNKFNETNYSAELSEKLGIKNYRRLLTADECFDAFPEIQYHMDEPQSNPSCVPLWFLAKLASEHVTVVLSGEGADEIFAGYEEYNVSGLAVKYRKIPAPLRRAAARAAKHLPYFKGHDFIIKNSGRPEDYYYGQAHIFDDKEALDLLKPEYRGGKSARQVISPIFERTKGKSELVKKQYADLNLWLPGDILLKADKMSMAHSLELRVPFLDKEVMRMAGTIPSEYKINGKNTKYVFRKAANRVLPDDWADREKKGFPVPIRYWLREDKYFNIVKDYFTSDFAAEFFDTDKIMRLLCDHKEERANNGRKIWTGFTFLTWYKRFFIDFE